MFWQQHKSNNNLGRVIPKTIELKLFLAFDYSNKIVNKERLEYIDFAKGWAILSIVIFHYCQPYVYGIWSKAIMIGGTGVHLFILLSGFGLGLSSQKMKMYPFYKKRFTKILIPYYLIIVIIYIVNSIYGFYGKNTLYALGGHFFLYKMFDEKIITSFGYHFWFISTIVQFYIVFPLIISLKKRINDSLLFIIISICISLSWSIIIAILNIDNQRIFNSFFLQYLWEFNLGIFFADLYIDKKLKFWEQNNNILTFLSIIGIVTMGFMVMKGGKLGRTFNDIPALIGYSSLAILMYKISLNKFKLIKNFFVYASKISYELYLIHMLIFVLLNNFFEETIKLNSTIFISLFFVLPLSLLFAHCFMLINRFFLSKLWTRNIP